MRYLSFVILLSGTIYAQSMVEHAAAAAGGSVGGVAGKKVSDGLTKIFTKVDQTTAKAADGAKSANAPLLEVGPGVPKASTAESVPPPPPVKRASVHKAHAAEPVAPPVAAPVPEPVAPPPPPPEVTAEDIQKITQGMQRADLLKLGAPASRITMFEDGHVLEIYRYQAKDATLGVVRLIDGSVNTVQRP
jgi:hypothetical protein